MARTPIWVCVMGLLVHLLLLLGPPWVWSGGSPGLHEILYLGLMSGFLWLEQHASRGRLDRPGPQEARLALVTGATLLLVAWIGLAESLSGGGGTPGAVGVGGAVIALGVSLRWLAFRHLGSAFQTGLGVVTGQPLVQRGLYAWLRHPSELGILLIGLGAGLLLGSALALGVCAGLLLPLVWARLRQEDHALEEVFGLEFSAYRVRVGGLWPRLLTPRAGGDARGIARRA